MAAYLLYAGTAPPLSMQCLVYMALVSRDADEQPWYGQGHEALAEHALGRPEPITESDLRAVRRAVRPLLAEDIKAIEVDRRPAGRRDGSPTIRYRLNLYAGRFPSGVEVAGPQGDCSERRTKSGRNAGRKTSERRTKTVPAPDGNRPPKEEEEEEEREEEEVVASATQVQTARETGEPTQEIHLAEGEPSSDRATCERCSTYLDPDGSCLTCRAQTREDPQ